MKINIFKHIQYSKLNNSGGFPRYGIVMVTQLLLKFCLAIALEYTLVGGRSEVNVYIFTMWQIIIFIIIIYVLILAL